MLFQPYEVESSHLRATLCPFAIEMRNSSNTPIFFKLTLYPEVDFLSKAGLTPKKCA